MKKITLLTIAFLLGVSLHAQHYKPAIDSLLQQVSQDSLISFVRILSGEDSVVVDGQKVRIKNRIAATNSLAEEYIFEKLSGYGYSPVQNNYSYFGTNVYAIKEGAVYPNIYYMICAHYDATTDYCADDNGSGTATVLEAARVMADKDFAYSIIFALWDEEEDGLLGSADYALHAKADAMEINGVVNIDMIGWDSNDDGLVEIHSNSLAQSKMVADTMEDVNLTYGLSLTTQVYSPGTTASDHASFWSQNYGGVLLIEGYWSGDFNNYYHSVNDRVLHFNQPYFHRAAKLAVGTTATLAGILQTVGVDEQVRAQNILLNSYPNPSKGQTTVSFVLNSRQQVNLKLFNSMGQPVKDVVDRELEKGVHKFRLSTDGLPAGVYILLFSNGRVSTSKTVVVTH